MSTKKALSWYQNSYSSSKFGAQRNYPNEELCRFIGRNYASMSHSMKGTINMLEVGCGTGSNLAMLCKEGFKTFGLDISTEGLSLTEERLKANSLSAHLIPGSMCDIDNLMPPQSIDVIVDIFSSNCLCEVDFLTYLKGLSKVLKPNGTFFLYTPSKRSDAFLSHSPSKLVDDSTLDGILRKDSPFYGNYYHLRFEHERDLNIKLASHNLEISYMEKVSRTYNSFNEYFEFLVVEAKSQKS